MLLDKDIREPLFEFLEEQYGNVRIFEELSMGDSRADIVMVTVDALYGIEIKSDADTYQRLARQVVDYDKYYDYNIVVVGGTHGLSIRKHVPDWWGVITVELVDDVFDFYILQRPSKNPNVIMKRKLELLWRPELAELQELHNMPKYKDKRKSFVVDSIAKRVPEKIDADVLNREISDILFERDYTTIEETLTEYRKGELQKKIDVEEDVQKKIELMMEQAVKKSQLKARQPKKKRRRR